MLPESPRNLWEGAEYEGGWKYREHRGRFQEVGKKLSEGSTAKIGGSLEKVEEEVIRNIEKRRVGSQEVDGTPKELEESIQNTKRRFEKGDRRTREVMNAEGKHQEEEGVRITSTFVYRH